MERKQQEQLQMKKQLEEKQLMNMRYKQEEASLNKRLESKRLKTNYWIKWIKMGVMKTLLEKHE